MKSTMGKYQHTSTASSHRQESSQSRLLHSKEELFFHSWMNCEKSLIRFQHFGCSGHFQQQWCRWNCLAARSSAPPGFLIVFEAFLQWTWQQPLRLCGWSGNNWNKQCVNVTMLFAFYLTNISFILAVIFRWWSPFEWPIYYAEGFLQLEAC